MAQFTGIQFFSSLAFLVIPLKALRKWEASSGVPSLLANTRS
jgi:hypothetical protein